MNNAFSKVIGYESVKKELNQIVDMVRNPGPYAAIGAALPRGVLLYGKPGVGKTQLAQCLCDQLALPTYTLRKNSAQIVDKITELFRRAKDSQKPSVIFLDDVDKLSTGKCTNSDEYIAVQSGIDEIADSDIFVVATANDLDSLPRSLLRAGRFDRLIEVCSPTPEDTVKLVNHYLSQRKADRTELSAEDIANAMSSCSCAELHAIFNEAAIYAAYNRNNYINKDDVKNAILRRHYEAPDAYSIRSKEEVRRSAVHEAGHLVIAELLCPGSVGFASVRSSGRDHLNGFVHTCKDLTPEMRVMISLGGAAAVERYYGDSGDGCECDFKRAAEELMRLCQSGVYGLSQFDPSEAITQRYFCEPLDGARSDGMLHALLEVYQRKVRTLLAQNFGFLSDAAELLEREQALFASEILKLREKRLDNLS